jgi:type I restriction enzyme S subunit
MSLDNLPVEWIPLNLGKVVEYGKTTKVEPSQLTDETWVLELEDIEKDSSKILNQLSFAERKSKSTKNSFNAGDVLYGKLRPYLNKVVMAPKDGVCTTEIIPLNGNGHILNKFLFYWIKGNIFQNYVQAVSYGVNMPRLGTNDGLKAPFILVPIAEQQEIVRQLDVILAQVEQIKVRLDAIPAILKKFRQSVLADAVSGKLTDDWRAQNSSSYSAISDHSKIIEGRIRVVKGKNSKPEQHLKNEEYLIPDSWLWTSLDTLTSKIVDGTHHTPTYIESGVPFISVKDINDGRIDFSNTKYISEEEHKELSKRCNVEKGDLLITKSGTIGRTAIVTEGREFSLFVSVALLKPASSEVNLKFINLALQKWVNEIDVSSRIVGSAIKNLHLKDMRVLAIPFAPLKEQEVIVDNVETFFKLADHLEDVIASAQKRVNLLTQSILAKAFSGELTAEWREQHQELITGINSAESLLAKIQAEREASKPVKKAKKVK